MYFKIVFTNGYCGCNEEHYIKVESEQEAKEFFENNIEYYGFFDPDSRFVDEEDYETTEEYFQAIEEYQNSIYESSWWEEITEEEYDDNI